MKFPLKEKKKRGGCISLLMSRQGGEEDPGFHPFVSGTILKQRTEERGGGGDQPAFAVEEERESTESEFLQYFGVPTEKE